MSFIDTVARYYLRSVPVTHETTAFAVSGRTCSNLPHSLEFRRSSEHGLGATLGATPKAAKQKIHAIH